MRDALAGVAERAADTAMKASAPRPASRTSWRDARGCSGRPRLRPSGCRTARRHDAARAAHCPPRGGDHRDLHRARHVCGRPRCVADGSEELPQPWRRVVVGTGDDHDGGLRRCRTEQRYRPRDRCHRDGQRHRIPHGDHAAATATLIEAARRREPAASDREQLSDFMREAYELGWVNREFDWPRWARSPEAQALRDPEAISQTTQSDLEHVLTTVLRQDRFA